MRKRQYISDINITPFVDVMLVLLVIFLVTTPAMVSQVPVSLPDSSGNKAISNKSPVFITVSSNGNTYVGEIRINNIQQLNKVLQEKNLMHHDMVYVRGDKNASYGDIMKLMNTLKTLGYSVSLVTKN